MNTFEAMKALGEGKKVRRRDWEKDAYVIMDKRGIFLDEKGNVFGFINLNDNDWEIVDEREEAMPLLRALYDILNTLIKDDWNQYDEFTVMHDYTNYMVELFKQLKEMNKYYKLDK